MMTEKKISLLAALALISLTGSARANTTGGTSPTIGPFSTNFGSGTGANPVTSLTLPLFNTSLGTLTGISFTIGGTVTTTFQGTDLSGNANQVTLTSSGKISLYTPPAPPSAASLVVFTTPANSLGPIPVAPGASFGPSAVIASGNNSVASYAGSFLPFELAGGGFFTMPVTASGLSSASDTNGNITTRINTTASAFATVLYTYTPVTSSVPEPGSVALVIGLGVGGGGFLLRRRRVVNHGRGLSPYDM